MPFQAIEDPTKLRRVLEAVLLIEQDLELPALLRHVVEEACSMTGPRYGALGVLNDNRSALAEFVTVGLDAEQVATIGLLPTGKGVLGALIVDPEPLRLSHLGDHPDSYGFPPGHPPMTSFLGVPIKTRTRSTEISTSLTRSDGPSSRETMWPWSKHWPWQQVSPSRTRAYTNRSRLPPSSRIEIAWPAICTITSSNDSSASVSASRVWPFERPLISPKV